MMGMLPSPSQVARSHTALYEAFYRQVDPAETDRVSAVEAAAFLKRSGLPDAILSKIWDMSDPQGKGFLNKQGFYVALKLIALHQNGKDLTLANMNLDLPPPQLQTTSDRNSPAVDWNIKPVERKKYEEMFYSMGPIAGKLPGDKVRPVMLNSKLPMDILGKIWDLSDTDQDGYLSKEEFILAMHLVYKALENIPVPPVLPPELISILKRKHSISAMGQVLPDVLPQGIDNTMSSRIRRSSTPSSDIIGRGSTWIINAIDKAKYDEMFHALDTDIDGFVTGADIKDTFLKSGLSQPVLAHIWNLCDIKQNGKLNSEQFALAMYLVQQKLQGIEVPATLYSEMIPPTLRPKPTNDIPQQFKMAAASDQWELSKENIQPIQKGRKPEVLKVALASHPEDLISQQKQAFETELRTYTGYDPLSVWYDYINWVEQNFPKGGRDGHLHQLIWQCLSQLISKTHYYNDNRFIEIWLKYANISQKAAEIYENMYTCNIGCKSAPYFMAWSWELEQQGNLKKANEVINKGVQCMAEPLEKLKAYRSEFEIRVATRVMSGGEQNADLEENGRSAFSVLKPQKKKNVAPIVRVGASIVEPNPSSLTLGRQQPMPKSNVSSARVPFKIYNAENLPPSLPVQTENPQPFTFYTDAHKENKKKPSKWNKVQVKQAPSVVRSFADAAPGFTLHKDEDIPPASTPSVSHVLKETKKPSSQDIDIFKPQEQKTRSMYDTTKVNIGGEEFSLEEIKAAAWFKAEKERKLIEQERKLQEQQALIKSLEQKLQLLEMEKKTNVAPSSYSNMDPSQKIIIYSDPSPTKLQQADNINNPVNSYGIPYEQENQLRGADIENVPPSDYIQDENKRELAGILQPSKNIPFIPLEDQYDEEEDEENPENEDCLYKENNNHPLQDETLIPPCNTEQFVSAAFLSSTPRTQVKPINYTDLQCSFKEEADNCKDEPKEPTGNEEKAVVFQAPVEEATYSNRQVYKSEIKSSIREHSIFPALQGQLSVILETSRECYKSSSSSGSSGSATRLSQFSQCYSHEKSNIQRYLSKTDVFKEPRPVSHSRELSSNAPKDNSYCALKDTKSLGKSTAEKDIFEIHCTNIDPFDEALRNNFLASVRKSNTILENLPMSTKPLLKSYKAEDKIEIAGVTYVINDLVAEGAYGKVYEASKQFSLEQNFDSSNTKFALKACKGSNDWEYYICSVLHERFNEVGSSPDVRSSVMKLFSACRFPNGIMLVSEFHPQGTLLDLVNLYKTQNTSMPEIFACFLTLEILQMVEKLHECKIVHCDIKPDNILVRDNMWDFDILEFLDQKTALLQLIDFGRAIDLEMFQGGVCFNAKIKENCIEMRENKPWVFQLDWYGVLNCIHIILFSEYMKVKQNKSGRWEIEKKIKRYWDQTIWVPLFDELLNIPSCYKEPDLKKFTNMIVSKLRKNEAPFLTYFRRMEWRMCIIIE